MVVRMRQGATHRLYDRSQDIHQITKLLILATKTLPVRSCKVAHVAEVPPLDTYTKKRELGYLWWCLIADYRELARRGWM